MLENYSLKILNHSCLSVRFYLQNEAFVAFLQTVSNYLHVNKYFSTRK